MAISLGPGYGYEKSEEGLGVDFRQAGKDLGKAVSRAAKGSAAIQSKVTAEKAKLDETLGKVDLMNTDDQYAYWSNGIQVFADQRDAINAQLSSKAINKKEYLASINTLNGQADQWMVINQQYTQDYAKYIDYIEDPKNNAGRTPRALGSSVESFGNLHNTKLVYKNGKFVNVKLKDDGSGNMVEDASVPAKDMNTMIKLLNFKQPAFNTTASVKKIKGVLDANQTTDAAGNIITSVKDLENFDDLVVSLSQTEFTDDNGLSAAEYWANAGKSVGFKGTVNSKGELNGYDILLDFTTGENKPRVVEANFDIEVMEDDGSGTLVETVVSVNADDIQNRAVDDLANIIADTYGKKIKKPTSSSRSNNAGVQATLDNSRSFIQKVNNLLTDTGNPASSLNIIASNLGANNIDYTTNQDGDITAYVFDDFEDGRQAVTVPLFDSNGHKKPNKVVIEEIYGIWSNTSKGGVKAKVSAFNKAFTQSKVAETDTYPGSKQDLLKMDQGTTSQDIKIFAGIGRSLSPEDYLKDDQFKGNYIQLYKTSFAKTRDYVPQMYRGKADITQTNNDITISIKQGTKFRHNPLKIVIPKTDKNGQPLSDQDHIVIQKEINKVLIDNPNIKNSAELLTLLDDAVDTKINDKIDFQ